MRTFVKALPGNLLILLFIYAAVSKLADFDAFQGQMYNQAFPRWMACLLVYALPTAEILTVILLLFPATYLYGLALSSLMLTMFSGYIVLVLLHFWSRTPCSCGGILNHMPWGFHLFFNTCFLIPGLAAMYFELKERRSGSSR